MMDDKDGANTPPRGASSAPPPQPSKSEQDVASESSDDDDWFNKSLDDFDIPTVKDKDLWSGEEEEDDESVKKKKEKPQSKDSTQEVKPTEKKKKKKKKERKGQAASAHNSSTENQSHSSENDDSEDEKVTEIWSTGVAFAFRPEEGNGLGMQLQLARRLIQRPSEEQASKPEKAQDCSPTHGEEKHQRKDGHHTEAEKPVEELGTGASTGKTKKKPKSDEKVDQQQNDVVEDASKKRPRKQKGSKSKQTEPVDKKGKVNKKSEDEDKEEAEKGEKAGGGEEEEDGKEKRKSEVVYFDVEAEVVPEEELTEEWFAKQLAALPTLFNHRRVHKLSEARLRSNITMLSSALEEPGETSGEGDKDGQRIMTVKEVQDDDEDLVAVDLMKTDEGDYDCVMKFKEISDLQEDTDEENERKKVARALRLRSCMPTNFRLVLNWLLGKKQEAEAEARDVVRKYPFSLGAVANLFYMMWRRGERKEAAQLLSHFATLKKLRPSVYEGIMCEEQKELGKCYTELGPEFIPDAIAYMEKALQNKPHWYDLKWDLALNLRRMTNANHTWTQPMRDIVTPLLKATDILLALIRDCGQSDLEIKTAAAAELGEVLNGCQFDEELKNTVGKRAEDAGLNAAKCFDMVMQEEDTSGSNFIRAGKFFRYSGQLHKSEKALKKAVAVQNSAKAHHQLALTLKRLVKEEKYRAFQSGKTRRQGKKPPSHGVGPRRGESRQNLGVISRSRLQAGDSHMTSLQRGMKAIMYQSFTREDKYVSETMDHLNKAIMLSHGENCSVSYDLGLMYKALGEYSDALEQFRIIADIDTEPATIVGAFEQSGLVCLEKCSLEENETRARELKDEGKSMLTMAILVQAHIVRQFRDTDHFHAVWRSCYTLGQYLQLQQEVEGVFEEDSSVEIWLLRLLRVYADTLPVLVLLQQISQRDAESPQIVMEKLRKYFRDERYEDVVLFTSLLHLTQLGGQMKADGVSVPISLKALVQTARSKLMAYIKVGLLGSTFNSNMAGRFFHWAWEEIFLHGKDVCHHPHTPAAVAVCAPGRTGPPQNQEEKDSGTASPLETSASVAVNESRRQDTGPPPLPSTRHETAMEKSADGRAAAHTTAEQRQNPLAPQGRTGATGGDGQEEGAVRQSWTPPWADEAEEEEHKTFEYHVVVLHDPHDPEACRFSQDLHRVLLQTYGLKTYIQDPDAAMDLVTRATAEAIDSAHQLVFVIGCKEVSPVLESYIQHVNAKFPEHDGMTAASRQSTSHAISSLVLSDASVPLPQLQNWPSLPWLTTSSFAAQQFGQTKKWVDSVCKLFCFLRGIDITF